MKSPARQLVGFALGLVVFLVLLEGLARWRPQFFEAASHRALAKVAMLDLHPNVPLLFLGTSRFQDGVSPPLVTGALKKAAPTLGDLAGFNAAFTGSSLDALTSLAPRLVNRNGLRMVVIELSGPQISNGPALLDAPVSADVTTEDALASAARELRFIAYRKAFVPENFGRLLKLMIFGNSLSGWETQTGDQIKSWRGIPEPAATGFQPALWSPRVFTTGTTKAKLTASQDRACEALTALAAQFKERCVKVAFAVPPLSQKWKSSERVSMAPLCSELARRAGCEVWDYSSLVLDQAFFGNPSHLGATGRAHFSAALAEPIARSLSTP